MNRKSSDKPQQSRYFRSLEKKRLEWQSKLDKAKFNFVVDKLIGDGHTFVRNYNIFSLDKYTAFNKANNLSKQSLNVSNDSIRGSIVSKLEKDNPAQYRRKAFERDSFASIYQKKPSMPSLIYLHNDNRNKRSMMNSLNEKPMLDIQLIQSHKSTKDILPSIEDSNKMSMKYFDLSISKTNLSL